MEGIAKICRCGVSSDENNVYIEYVCIFVYILIGKRQYFFMKSQQHSATCSKGIVDV